MRGSRPLAFVVVWGSCLVGFVCFGVACVLSPHHVVFPFPSMMTWALRPHGVRTRGKKIRVLGAITKENMKGQEGHVLSAKDEFIAPSFTLSHHVFGCLNLLEVRTLLPFLVGFVWGFGCCLVVFICCLVRISLSY